MGKGEWNKVAEIAKIKPHGTMYDKTPWYTIFRLVLAPLIRSMMRVDYKGLENIPKNKHAIFAANHLSHIDPILVIAGARRKLHYMAKDEHFKHIHSKIIMKTTGQIPTYRETGGLDALASASAMLNGGHSLGIFPEGTRSRATSAPFIQKGKTGIARLASSYPELPIIPIAINGSREWMTPKQHKFPRIWRKMCVTYGKPITWNEWVVHKNGGDMTKEKINELLKLNDVERENKIRKLQRKFTNQFMNSIKMTGAP